MHMSDALISPEVGGAMIISSLGVIKYSASKIDVKFSEKRVPYMAVVGAFVFALQMVNFAIPGTGSSGHIGGGMLLAILLGPYAAFLTMGTILMVQALFFADGGLLAFGCNLINLGFFTCFIAYPLVYKSLAKRGGKMMYLGAVFASVIGLQLGSLGVVIETVLSGQSDIPFKVFLTFMQPIHLVIGLVEGVVTAVVVGYLYKQKEDLHYNFFNKEKTNSVYSTKLMKKIIVIFILAIIFVGGFLSIVASQNPDGLEWAIEKSNITLKDSVITKIQAKIAVLPDYGLKTMKNNNVIVKDIGTSFSGIIGSLLIIVIVFIIGVILRGIQEKKANRS